MKVIRILSAFSILLTSFNLYALSSSEVFGRLPFVTQLIISPDGQRIAYLQDVDGKYNIVTKKLFDKSAKPIAFGLEGDANIRAIEWGNSDNILFWATVPYYSKGDYETFTLNRVAILNVQDGHITWPFDSNRFNYNIAAPILVNKLVNEPNKILLSNYYTGVGQTAQINGLYKVDLNDGDKEKFFSSYDSSRWVTDKSGEVAVYRQYEKKYDDNVWKYRKNKEADFVDLVILKDKEYVHFDSSIRGISEDWKTIYYFSNNEKHVANLFKASIDGNKVVNSEVVSSYDKYDADGYITDSATGLISGVTHIADYSEYEYFEKDLAQVNADLKATFPDSEIQITSYSNDHNRFIAKVSGSEYPNQFFFYDVKAGQLSMLAEGFPDASKLPLGKVVNYTYTTSDNFNIESYLTMPKIASDNKPPLIVIPHGGPESRVDASFDWERQFFVSKGFAVFQPNFRGSSGYGNDFAEAGYGEWGEKMQRDVDEGVESLIKAGKVDPQRICVVGASYGGYVAMYSATTRQNLYKCSVSYGGVSDLDDMFFHENQQKNGNAYWEESIGKRDNQELLKKHSPLFLVSEKTRPILLFHGENDTRVPSFQSKNMYKALKKAQIKSSRYIELENEDHYFTRGESRRIYLEESLKFISEQLNIKNSTAP